MFMHVSHPTKDSCGPLRTRSFLRNLDSLNRLVVEKKLKNRSWLRSASVEFADYQCPYCKRFFSTTFPALNKEYIDTGKVRFVLKDLPLPMHSNARPAAIASYCAGDQGKFWAMHDKLFTDNGQLTDQLFKTLAKDIGLNAEQFADCLKSNRYDAATSADVTETSKQGITVTPTFVVGRTTDDMIAGSIIGGAQPIEAFRAQIEPLLKQDKKNPS
jgi:protein-disulfide isomerase